MYTHTHTTHTHTHTHTHPHHTPTHTHVHTGMLRGAGVRAVDDGVASVNGSTFRYIRTCALSVCGRGRVVASSCVFRHLLVCLYLSVYLSGDLRETSGRPRGDLGRPLETSGDLRETSGDLDNVCTEIQTDIRMHRAQHLQRDRGPWMQSDYRLQSALAPYPPRHASWASLVGSVDGSGRGKAACPGGPRGWGG